MRLRLLTVGFAVIACVTANNTSPFHNLISDNHTAMVYVDRGGNLCLNSAEGRAVMLNGANVIAEMQRLKGAFQVLNTSMLSLRDVEKCRTDAEFKHKCGADFRVVGGAPCLAHLKTGYYRAFHLATGQEWRSSDRKNSRVYLPIDSNGDWNCDRKECAAAAVTGKLEKCICPNMIGRVRHSDGVKNYGFSSSLMGLDVVGPIWTKTTSSSAEAAPAGLWTAGGGYKYSSIEDCNEIFLYYL